MMSMAVLLTGAALTACVETDGIVPTERSGIDVSTTTIEMSEMTRAAVTGKADRLVWVLTSADGAVTSGVQTSGLDVLAIDCAAGTYALTVLANMGDVPTIGEYGRMTFGKVGNAYALRREVTVERGQRTSLSMELKRVAKVCLPTCVVTLRSMPILVLHIFLMRSLKWHRSLIPKKVSVLFS